MDQDLEQTRYWRTLRRKITSHFSLGELKVLCHDVMVDYDELAGEEKVEKVANLIGYLARRGRLADLVVVLKEERPKADWEESIPSPDKQVQDAEKLLPLAKDDLILREYLEKLQQYLPPDALEKARLDSRLQEIISTLTKTYMNQLDLWRRTRLVRHLSENNLQEVISLAGIDLSGADLSGINLQGANLNQAILTSAFLANVNLHKATLVGAGLKSAFLVNSNAQGANLSRANLSGARLYKSDLRTAILDDAILERADFSETDLRGSVIEHWRTSHDASVSYRKMNAPKFDGALLDNPIFLLERLEFELKRGNFEVAINDATKLCEFGKGDKWHHYLRGIAYKGLGKEHLANQDFSMAWGIPDGKEIVDFLFASVMQDNKSNELYFALSGFEPNEDTSDSTIGLAFWAQVFPTDERVMEFRGNEKLHYSGVGPIPTNI
ncbi:MAG: pentapeptide repeat-containing protein [bacterium]|nr:pentapeptide repeat-containing protein [bacterium]